MSDIPADLRYTPSHEWVRTEVDGTLTVGITDHAQQELGNIVYFELPEVGSTVEAGNGVAVVESERAASDVYAPASGEIIDINAALADKPEAVNEDPYGAWVFKIKPQRGGATNGLLDAAGYSEKIGE